MSLLKSRLRQNTGSTVGATDSPWAVRIFSPAFFVVLLSLGLAACQTPPPISIGQRDSLAGQGVIITVTNTSDDYLHEVEVEISSPTDEVKKLVISALEPHESTSIGWLKLAGWPIPEGSKVQVRAKDFSGVAGPFTTGAPGSDS